MLFNKTLVDLLWRVLDTGNPQDIFPENLAYPDKTPKYKLVIVREEIKDVPEV